MAVGTTVLTSSLEQRSDSTDRHPIWERVITYTFADNDTTLTTHSLGINGILQKVIVKLGTAVDGGATATFAILDNGDNSIFSQAALADATTFQYSLTEPLSGTIDLNVTPTDPGGAWTITVTLRGI